LFVMPAWCSHGSPVALVRVLRELYGKKKDCAMHKQIILRLPQLAHARASEM